MKVIDITELEFEEEVLKYPNIVVAKFYGNWCGPCKMLASIIDQMPEDKFDGLKIVNIDVDKCLTLAKQFGVMSVPTLLVFKDGAQVDKIVGFRNQKQLTEIFDQYLSSGK